jgi:flagellar biosynthesis/type III secretory pathway protein FliH
MKTQMDPGCLEAWKSTRNMGIRDLFREVYEKERQSGDKDGAEKGT